MCTKFGVDRSSRFSFRARTSDRQTDRKTERRNWSCPCLLIFIPLCVGILFSAPSTPTLPSTSYNDICSDAPLDIRSRLIGSEANTSNAHSSYRYRRKVVRSETSVGAVPVSLSVHLCTLLAKFSVNKKQNLARIFCFQTPQWALPPEEAGEPPDLLCPKPSNAGYAIVSDGILKTKRQRRVHISVDIWLYCCQRATCVGVVRVAAAGRGHRLWSQLVVRSPGQYRLMSTHHSTSDVSCRLPPVIDNAMSRSHRFRLRHRRRRRWPGGHFRFNGRGHVTWSERRRRRAAIGWRRRLRGVTTNRQSCDSLIYTSA